jgi:hypothetical protein
MATLDPNTVIGLVHGKIGDLVFVQTRDGKIIVRHRPVREAEFTARELGNQSLFARAGEHVHKLRQEPERYAVYQQAAKLRGKRACDLANADFRHPPVIQDIDVSAYSGNPGEVLRIQAVDDFGVVAVEVILADLTGTVIEQGAAVLDEASGLWLYPARIAVGSGQTIVAHVNAADRAGNVVTKSLDHALPSAHTF